MMHPNVRQSKVFCLLSFAELAFISKSDPASPPEQFVLPYFISSPKEVTYSYYEKRNG